MKQQMEEAARQMQKQQEMMNQLIRQSMDNLTQQRLSMPATSPGKVPYGEESENNAPTGPSEGPTAPPPSQRDNLSKQINEMFGGSQESQGSQGSQS